MHAHAYARQQLSFRPSTASPAVHGGIAMTNRRDEFTTDCRACGEVVDAVAVIDGDAGHGAERVCPECRTPLSLLWKLAQTDLDVEDCDGEPGDRLSISRELRREQQEQLEALDDPAETDEEYRDRIDEAAREQQEVEAQ